jgi:hypothetical protein
MDKFEGMPTFPADGAPGISLLDYFALHLAAGFCASDLRPQHHEIPRIAYDLAAEMIREGRARAAKS